MECIKTKYLSKQDIYVPCGRCAFCLATRRSDWASRIYFERQLHLDAYFVTLTYADEFLTYRSGVAQLVKRDLQLWFKKVRKAGHKFRYYAVGEYGSHTMRPHYHIIVFGYVPEDVLRDSWAKGIVHIGHVNDQSVLYALKYVINSRFKGYRNGRVAPWATMSRKPGLGANYLDKEVIDWHKSGRKNYLFIDGQRRHLPRYYKEKIFSKIDRVRIAVRDGRKAIESLRATLAKYKHIKISKQYPYGALSYYEDQLRTMAARIIDKSRQDLTI